MQLVCTLVQTKSLPRLSHVAVDGSFINSMRNGKLAEVRKGPLSSDPRPSAVTCAVDSKTAKLGYPSAL